MKAFGCLLALTAAVLAQSFQVASIRVNHSGERIQRYQPNPGGRFTATNCSLNLLLQYAYAVYRFQISGAPDWVFSDRFDIAAKADPGEPRREIPGMVQHLIEERFQLKYHWETKDSPAYNLVVARPGKLRSSAPGDCPDSCGALRNTPGDTFGLQMSSADLAASLASFVGRPIVDKTGLTGKYDVELQWTPDGTLLAASPPTDAGPSVFTALRDQLGLRLEPTRAPIKTFVIDHVDKPSEN